MGISETIAGLATTFIDRTGYLSVFVLMVMESMVFPVPSEAVMPFAGFLVVTGRFSLAGVIAASTAGSIAGSLLSYAMGAYGGEPFFRRFGKYFLLDLHELAATQRYFQRHGQITILVCRFIPVVRHLISIPAGVGRMPLAPFVVYTIIGAGIWNAILTVAGMKLKQNWEAIMQYSHVIDIVVVVLLAAGFGVFVIRHAKRRRLRQRGA
ncbi:MAG TPA: DedA family protein [Candidatus Krumholzibacteria bacterium]|nr:DedA family protein [Candidatus Krumholzibacteria bacterium]HPD73081.1 DedA family protein [Candidatus Krumholzibacteria bacterium]HRY41881.1 DedA family protein [Candidatus Krumholzibacteria bacterium]